MELKYHYFKLFILCLGIFILYLIPIDFIEGRSFCIFFNLTGNECFGCGLTRAFFNMTRFNLVTSLNYNKLILFFGPAIVISYIYEIIHSTRYIINQRNSSKGIIEHIFLFF